MAGEVLAAWRKVMPSMVRVGSMTIASLALSLSP
jgi:hypothetical protein